MPPFDNRSLFSDHYLGERLPEHPVWREDVSEPFRRVRELYEAKRDILPGCNEAQTEEEFIKPILREILGWSFDVQEGVKRQGRINRPDYIFFPDETAKAEALKHRLDETPYYDRAVAVGDAKFWERPLDLRTEDARESLSNVNPSFQIVNYLTATGVDWGILTNGAAWRLYYARARSRVDTYYEVNLRDVLEQGDEEAFRYFHRFFRAAAFVRDPQSDRSFLESVYEESVTYGIQLEKRLKARVFDEIFSHLAEGFADHRRRKKLAYDDEETLGQIYHGTLRLLYRLLFILHAEARGLLPVDDYHGYRNYSLLRLQERIAERLDRKHALSAVSTGFWDWLQNLVRIIDEGDASLDVPRYNGGLFNRSNPANAFLNEHRVGDYFLAPAIELLTRETDAATGQKRFIDYKTLNVEQLGSIYEGLLEFRLKVADEDVGVVRSRKAEVYRPRAEVKDPIRTIPKGSLYLLNDKGERKATGSYYTPHYIVEYIVENTLGPVLEQRAARFRELMAEIGPAREKAAELDRKLAEGRGRSDAALTRWTNERNDLRRKLARLEPEATETLLSIRVCDPAMGSGHFLVYAVDWLTEHLISVLNEFPDNPVLREIAEIREQIMADLQAQDIHIEADRLKDTNLLKRMVMKRCIYGVDLNLMAVELAKLSLWLDSFTVGAPLSFLNHHLKHGNSLVGTTVEEVRKALEHDPRGQTHLFGGPFAGLLQATELMREVARYTDATFDEVEKSAATYGAFERSMRPYKRILDIWVSRHFGNAKAEDLLRHHGNDVLLALKNGAGKLPKPQKEILATTEALQGDKRFFHWELEFPEVFVDLKQARWKENPGFDAVIGNPPYGMPTDPEFKSYARGAFYSSEGRDDYQKLFSERGNYLTGNGGKISLIVSSSLFTNLFDRKLREIFACRTRIDSLITFAYPVFDDPTVHSGVFVITKQPPAEEHTFRSLAHIRSPDELHGDGITLRQNVIADDPHLMFILLDSEEDAELFSRLSEGGDALGLFCHIRQCIKTGDDAEFVRFFDVSPPDPWKPVIGGSDVSRYGISWKKTYLKYGNWLARNWQNPSFFERDKIVVRETSERITAAKDSEQFYLLSTLYSIYFTDDFKGGENLDYLLALLNSSMSQYFMHLVIFGSTTGAFTKARTNHYARVPIRRISFTTSDDERSALVDRAKELHEAYLASGDAEAVLSFVQAQLDAEPERSDVMHDLLAFMAGRMIDLHKERQKLEQALDPFKFLNRGAAFRKFVEVFGQAVKYGDRLEDLSAVRHDIDGLALAGNDPGSGSGAGEWHLMVNLKLRDPATDWREFQKDGSSIAREWVPAYRFTLDEQTARFYRHALPVLREFTAGKTFPGGATRTTLQKLHATPVPVFDSSLNLTPLDELTNELAEVKRVIGLTDRLIDLIVYRLYGLTGEEVGVVEG